MEWASSPAWPGYCAFAGEGSELQQELSCLREENASLAQQVKGYKADVANLMSLGRASHTGSRQKATQ